MSEDTSLVEGDLQTGPVTRHVVYSRKTGVFHVLTDNPETNARIWENAQREELPSRA